MKPAWWAVMPGGVIAQNAALREVEAAMAVQPLSHHDILALVEPFSRGGRRVDLAASDRLGRRIAFAPREHEAQALVESLALETPEPGEIRLVRTLKASDGLVATLRIDSADAAGALARIEAVEPASQFRRGEGWALAFDWRIDAAGERVLHHATIRVERLVVKAEVLETRGTPADLRLTSEGSGTLTLPDDLLAVLGWAWGRLDARGEDWHGSVALAGRGPARSRDAEAKLERLARHLARTLAEPPARFHERFAAARWLVALRRLMPIAIGLGLIAGSFAFSKASVAQESLLRLLALNAPPLLLLLFFCQRELPRFEIPPMPRRSSSPAWRRP